jgi:hypothetical protein
LSSKQSFLPAPAIIRGSRFLPAAFGGDRRRCSAAWFGFGCGFREGGFREGGFREGGFLRAAAEGGFLRGAFGVQDEEAVDHFFLEGF